jgi:hypothetical protein
MMIGPARDCEIGRLRIVIVQPNQVRLKFITSGFELSLSEVPTILSTDKHLFDQAFILQSN